MQRRNFVFRLLPVLACASLVAVMPVTAAAWDWGFGFNTTKGSGVLKTETRSVAGFNRIGLSLPGVVEVIQGESEGLNIETDDNLLPLIETVVESGSLKLRLKDKGNISTRTLKITVNAKSIEGLSVGGSGDIRVAKLKTGKLKAAIAGSGDISITSLDADDLHISIAGSGTFVAGGKVNTLESSISGSGDVKAGKLESNVSKISIAGSGDATVWAKDTLSVKVAGSGDVKYYGDAKVSQSVAGSGSIKRLGSSPGV
jgi:hypothetical protein